MGAPIELHFIDSLIDQTNSREIEWGYFMFDVDSKDDPRTENNSLKEKLNLQELYDNNKEEIIFDATYFTKTSAGYIYFIGSIINSHHVLKLWIQKSKNDPVNVVIVHDDSKLYRLENAIIYSMKDSNSQEIESFIKEFLNE